MSGRIESVPSAPDHESRIQELRGIGTALTLIGIGYFHETDDAKTSKVFEAFGDRIERLADMFQRDLERRLDEGRKT